MLRQLVLSGALILLVTTVITAQNAQKDIIARLGTNDLDARDSIFSSFAAGVIALTGQSLVFKAAAPEQRVLIARGVVAAARAMTESGDFAERYALYRTTQRPVLAPGARTGDQARAEQQKQMQEAIRQATQMAGQIPAETRKQLEENIAEMQKQIAELNADLEHRAAIDKAAREFAEQSEREHKEKLAEFEASYPAEARALVARRLGQFLEVCSDVNYAAKLEQGKDGKFRFVDRALEDKPAEWKLCYRAGRPAVDAARVAAQEWLNAIGR